MERFTISLTKEHIDLIKRALWAHKQYREDLAGLDWERDEKLYKELVLALDD